MVTPPVDEITTTIATWGCISSTSTWRIVAVSIGGAVTSASRFVTCESCSVVARMASSTSRRMNGQLHRLAGHRQPALREHLVHVEAVAAVGGHAARRGVRMLEQPDLLQAGQLGAHRRRAPGDVVLLGDPLRAHGLVERHVSLDDLPQKEALALGDIHGPIVAGGPPFARQDV